MKKYDNKMRNEKNNGGLYKTLNMSIVSANILVAVSITILILCTLFALNNAGFNVVFDTNGGSHIETVKLMYGETIALEKEPIKQGAEFDGWFIDEACTNRWDTDNDKVMQSMTLYAGWSMN